MLQTTKEIQNISTDYVLFIAIKTSVVSQLLQTNTAVVLQFHICEFARQLSS